MASGKLTFEEIRRQNKNLLILYNDDRVSKGRHFLMKNIFTPSICVSHLNKLKDII